MDNISNVVVYNDGELELKVSVNEETIWLTQKQLAELFKVSKQNVSLHINNSTFAHKTKLFFSIKP